MESSDDDDAMDAAVVLLMKTWQKECKTKKEKETFILVS